MYSNRASLDGLSGTNLILDQILLLVVEVEQ